MEVTEQQPILAHNNETSTLTQTSSVSSTFCRDYETEAEHIYRNRASSGMFSSFRRPFLPKASPTQLFSFFTRSPGPVVPKDTPYSIRPAHISDVPDMVLIQARADWHMPTMEIFHPLRFKYPQEYLRSFWESGLRWLTQPGALTYVAVTHLPDGGEEVIGEMRFSRQGDGKKAAKRQGGWMWTVVNLISTTWAKIREKVPGMAPRSKMLETENQRSAAKEVLERFNHAENIWYGQREYKERWYVGTICVKDEWRGRGVGKQLMEVAINRCREERLPLTLSATENGVWLYRKLGFQTLEILEINGFDKDNKYELMAWDPRKRE